MIEKLTCHILAKYFLFGPPFIQMEKEIRELTKQRDLAQSRVEDLLRMVGNNQDSRQVHVTASSLWSFVSVMDDIPSKSFFPFLFQATYNHPKWQEGDAWEDEASVSESSSVADHPHPNGIRKFNNPHYDDRDSESSPAEPHLWENNKDLYLSDGTSSTLSIGKKFVRSNSSQSQEGSAVGAAEDSDESCKEVRCIEMEESSRDKNPESTGRNEGTLALTLSGNTDVTGQGMTSTPVNGNRGALGQRVHNVQMTIDSLVGPCPEETSPWASAADFPSSRSFNLTRSWSCRANLMAGSSSPDKVERTPPNRFEKGFPGRPEGFGRKFPMLTFSGNTTRLSRNDSQSSLGSASMDELGGRSVKNEDITSIQSFVAGMKEMAKFEYEKQLADGQVRLGMFPFQILARYHVNLCSYCSFTEIIEQLLVFENHSSLSNYWLISNKIFMSLCN